VYEHGNVVQNYLTENGVLKADPLFGISMQTRNSCVFVALTLIIKNEVAERMIQKISNIAREIILHAYVH